MFMLEKSFVFIFGLTFVLKLQNMKIFFCFLAEK